MIPGDRLARRILSFGWILVASPIALSAIFAWRDGWIPAGDTALVAAKIVDSVSFDPPLVGGWTSLGRMDVEPLHHAGPIGMWIIALPAWLIGAPGGGLALGAAAISLVSLALVATCTRRIGQPAIEVALLGLVAAMVASLGGDRLSDPNAPFIGIMPLLLFLVTAAAISGGHVRQLWIAIPAGSLAAQTHLGYVPLVVAVLVLIGVHLAVQSRRQPMLRATLWRRVVPIGVTIGLVCWVGPIVDQAAGSRNLTRLVSQRLRSDEPTLGMGQGLRLLVDTTTIPGGWMRSRALDGALPYPGPLETVLACLSIAVVVGIVIWARLVGDRVLVSIGSVGLVGLVVATLSSASVTRIPVGEGLLYYRLFWWPVGVMFTLTLAIGVLRFSSALLGEHTSWDRRTVPTVWASTAAAAIALALLPVGTREPDADLIDVIAPTAEHARAIADLDTSPESVLLLFEEPVGSDVTEDEFSLTLLGPTLIAQLRLRGIEVRFPAATFDSRRGPLAAYEYDHVSDGHENATILFRAGPTAQLPAPSGFTLVSSDAQAGGAGAGAIPSAVFVEDR